MESQLSSQVLTSVNVRRYAFVLQCEGYFNFPWEAINLLCSREMSGRISSAFSKYVSLFILSVLRKTLDGQSRFFFALTVFLSSRITVLGQIETNIKSDTSFL